MSVIGFGAVSGMLLGWRMKGSEGGRMDGVVEFFLWVFAYMNVSVRSVEVLLDELSPLVFSFICPFSPW